jgi:acyl-coenzyme A synthetase/AMP-(fatty) acid ligase
MTETASMIACEREQSVRPIEVPIEAIPVLPEVRCSETGSAETLSTRSQMLQIECGSLFDRELLWNEASQSYLLQTRSDGVWLSEDRAQLFQCGDQTWILPMGRDQDYVKIAGEAVSLSDLDARMACLLESEKIKISAGFVALNDERWGARLTLVLTEDRPDILEKWNRQGARSGLERVRRYHVIETFPRTELGKLKRFELTRRIEALEVTQQSLK